ncbi:Uncharacterised protein [Mycobacterium tuberculosis]|nr:Uncharacterised protein [Mycobacterium tuberculosis]SGA81345.1 Uncharacterised protein [Mycobacterium tuberculosis]SGA86102.1 Uncharacterised protein [Mycobacterium tuberculosis]SGA87700.1 Uncharacterised protein [Mycobacterium tuberculosis]SGB13032.1 Uncharacterised protein [Mycobacterium tuberculosis]
MRIILVGSGIAENTGQQSQHGFDHHHGRRLPAGQYVVADRDFFDAHSPGGILHDPLVDAFVAAAGEHQMALGGPALGGGLGKQHTGGRGNNQQRFAGTNFVKRFTPHRRLHHHSRAAAVGCVVHRVMHIVGPAPQVVHVKVDQARFDRLARQRLSQRVQAGGEDRHDIDAHALLQIQQAMGRINLNDAVVQ